MFGIGDDDIVKVDRERQWKEKSVASTASYKCRKVIMLYSNNNKVQLIPLASINFLIWP